ADSAVEPGKVCTGVPRDGVDAGACHAPGGWAAVIATRIGGGRSRLKTSLGSLKGESVEDGEASHARARPGAVVDSAAREPLDQEKQRRAGRAVGFDPGGLVLHAA